MNATAIPVLSATPSSCSPARSVTPPGLPWFYGPALIAATITMLLLLLIYAGLVMAVAGATLWHAWEHTTILKFTRTTALACVVRLCVYGAPIFVGAIVTACLVKPLLRSRTTEWTPYAITRASEPALFTFIEQICVSMSAPMPTRVVLDLRANASASLRRGLFSFASNDLVLTIGLPLVAALSTQQFAGVLAHEFGHFTQRRAMRLSYLVMGLAHWFGRVIYERDELDCALIAASHGARQGTLLSVVNLSVYLIRGLLRALMLVGQAVGCTLSRQMEFHADRYETAVAGSDAFVTTHRRLFALNAACESTYPALLRTFVETRQLPDDLPKLLAATAESLPVEVQEKVAGGLSETKTKLLDTHPCSRDRIRAALALNESGTFRATTPARALFKNFDTTSRLMTCLHYRQDCGLEVTEHNLVPAAEWQPALENEPSHSSPDCETSRSVSENTTASSSVRCSRNPSPAR